MEENENLSFKEEPALVIDEQAKTYLAISAKWAKFLSIIGFIAIGIMVIAAIAMFFVFKLPGFASTAGMEGLDADIQNRMLIGPERFFTSFFPFLYLIMAMIILYPMVKLYRFAEKTQTAIRINDYEILKVALENHKSYFKFTGIMTLVIIAFYIVIFLVFAFFSITNLK